MRFVYVVAGSPEEFLRWAGAQDPSHTDPEGWDGERVRYVRVASTDTFRGRKRPEFLFLAGWQRRPDWRLIYNRALAVGKRWWEK